MYNYNNQKMIEQRTIEVGEYIAATGATVRQAAKMFGISKSLVHRDMRGRLKDLDYDLWNDVQKKCLLSTSVSVIFVEDRLHEPNGKRCTGNPSLDWLHQTNP